MANLLSNTTIGGYQSIHTGNIGSYALTSITSGNVTTALGYTPYNATNPNAYITSSNNYYYVNPGNGYGLGFWGQVPTTYGITMANENAGYGVIYGLSEYHLYFSMTGGGNRGFVFRNDSYGAVTQIGGSGWQMWRGELYPGYNNGGIGTQTSYYIYGNTNNAGLRTNGNWLVNGNLYIGSRDVWFNDWFNQGVRTDSNPSFASIYLNGTQLTGTQTQQLKNTLGVTSLPYACDITVNGDANTFYAVQFWGGDQDVWRRIIIKRGYGETAPWDPIGTGVHHGGLLLDWEGNFGGWGGAEYADRIRVFNESYTNVCADMFIYSHSMGYVFMLRGGGAVYHLFSDQPINGFYQSGAPDILYSTSTLSYDDTWSGTNQYDVPAPAPLSLAQVNSSRIDGLRTKKQSLLDNRYLRQGVDISGIGTVTATNFLATNAFYLNGTSYYLNSTNGGIYTNARFETAGNLVVQGTTFLGNANGDEVHINDVLRLGATDSGDAHFFFGEGSSAGSDYGSHWYWDSAYTFNWYTRNAGTDTALFSYTTNDAYYVNWYRNFNMQNKHIHYINEAHFNGGTRFSTNDSHYLNFMTDATDYGAIRVISSTGALKGHLGHYDSNGFGLLNSSGNWGIRLNPGNAETLLFYAGNEKLRTDSAGAYVTGRLDVSSYVYTPGAIIANNIQGGYQVLNLDTIKNPGLYQYDGGIGGTQPLGTDWYNVKTIEIGSDGRYSQFVMPYSNNRIFYRSQVGGTWLSYVELITSGNIGSQSVNYATTAGALSSMNISQFTNNSGYITSGDTTTGIFTTYLGNGTSNISSGYTRVIRNENGAGGNPNYAPILHVAAGDTMWQIAGAHAGQTTLVWRSGYNGAWNTPWWTIYHSGNFTDNSSNWNTAFGWGNHASAGYQSASTAITTSNIGSQSVSYAATAGALSSMNISQFTNNSGYITGYTETDTLASVTGRGATTGILITLTKSDVALKAQEDGTGTAWRGRIGSFNASADKSSFLGNYSGRAGVFGHNNALTAWDDLWVNTLGVSGQGNLYLSWNTYVKGNSNDTNYAIIHAGNIGSQSVSYASTAGSAPNGSNINQFYDVTAGVGNGLRFWSGDSAYKISMGVGALYQYGPVTDYSIKMQMNNGDTARGFTWGRESYAPIAALNSTSGDMEIAGYMKSYGYRGNGNVGGTGAASWHPDGIYVGSTQWLYGTMYKNGSSIYDVGELKMNGGPYLQTYNDRNLIVKGSSSSDAGIEGRNAAGSNVFQIYGSGSDYGFLN
jgi:hypothetical protein